MVEVSVEETAPATDVVTLKVVEVTGRLDDGVVEGVRLLPTNKTNNRTENTNAKIIIKNFLLPMIKL